MPKGGNKNQEPVTYTTYLLNGNEYYHDTAFANATSSILNSVDGQLFTIESAAEQNLIYDWLGHYYPDVVWMGISDSVQEGDWRYDDGPLVGQSLVYENWGPGAPNADDLGTFHATTTAQGDWYAYNENAVEGYVVEFGGQTTFPGLVENTMTVGSDGSVTIVGSQGDNLTSTLYGGDYDATLYGLGGSDILEGGLGSDTLYGGSGADYFVFILPEESTASKRGAGEDTIEDFSSAEGDKLVLEFLSDAGIDEVTFVDKFSKAPGEAVFKKGELSIDIDGDGKSDFDVQMTDVTTLTSADFLTDYFLV